jgi:hypothetical protein
MATTLFSWGYWGWGNATRQLVQAVDASEEACGFAPPLFVDVRFLRGVRAAGFRDHAFEQLLGEHRYVWLRSLGNRSIERRTGPRIQIAEPSAAAELLDLGLAAAKERRRVLFFCACERPIKESGESCHRVQVAKLVRRAAQARGVALETVEWPGGEVDSLDLHVSDTTLRAIQRGRAYLPLAEPVQLARVAGLAWGSRTRLRSGAEELTAVTGPARFQRGGWSLPMLKVFAHGEGDGAVATKWADAFRREHGYVPQAVVPVQPGPRRRAGNSGRSLLTSCVYTIAHVDKLRGIANGDGRGTLTEAKPWTSGLKLLERANEEGVDLPILFADATDCSRLLFWAVLTKIDITPDGTRYRFERLRPLPRNRSPQDLVLLSSGRPIAPGYIRPYALCETPDFLR